MTYGSERECATHYTGAPHNSKCCPVKRDATRHADKSTINSGNLSKFLRYSNSKLTTKHYVGPDCQPITIDPSPMVDLLSKYFDTDCTADNGGFPTSAINVNIDSDLSTISFNATIVSKVSKKVRYIITKGTHWPLTSYI